MPLRNTQHRFGAISMLFHWVMSTIIIAMIGLGLYMVDLPVSLQKFKYYSWHKEWGVLVLMLATLRLAWRFSNIKPTFPPHMPSWEQFAAQSVHYVFYGLMFALPLTGWMLSSAAGLSVSFFGLFVLPDLVVPSEATRQLMTEIHKWLAYGLIAAILGHIGAALKHHFIDKDDIFRRMLP